MTKILIATLLLTTSVLAQKITTDDVKEMKRSSYQSELYSLVNGDECSNEEGTELHLDYPNHRYEVINILDKSYKKINAIFSITCQDNKNFMAEHDCSFIKEISEAPTFWNLDECNN